MEPASHFMILCRYKNKRGTDTRRHQNTEFYVYFWLEIKNKSTDKAGKKFIQLSARVFAVNECNQLPIS